MKALKRYKADHVVPIAAVATGFPSGQYSLKTRLEEIRWAVECGASEIDIVINRALALRHDWNGVYEVRLGLLSVRGFSHNWISFDIDLLKF